MIKIIESLLEELLESNKNETYISKEYNFQEYHIQHRRSRKSK